MWTLCQCNTEIGLGISITGNAQLLRNMESHPSEKCIEQGRTHLRCKLRAIQNGAWMTSRFKNRGNPQTSENLKPVVKYILLLLHMCCLRCENLNCFENIYSVLTLFHHLHLQLLLALNIPGSLNIDHDPDLVVTILQHSREVRIGRL